MWNLETLDLGADQRKVKKAELGIISWLSRNHESETSRTMRMRGANPRTRNRKKSKSNPIPSLYLSSGASLPVYIASQK
jgi:hypothetical protein